MKDLAASLPASAWEQVIYRDSDDEPVRSRFAFVRVIAARPVTEHRVAPREEWLIIEWPESSDAPSDYWLSNLAADTGHERLARLARLRWMIELDYRQLKGELGLDHYEGRSYVGFHHHCALVIAAHGFLTLERRTQITSGRPDPPPRSPTVPAHRQVLDRPLLHLPADDRPGPPPDLPSPTRVTTRQSPCKPGEEQLALSVSDTPSANYGQTVHLSTWKL